MSVWIILSDILLGLVWIFFLIGFSLFIFLNRRTTRTSNSAPFIAYIVMLSILWVTWYGIGSASAGLATNFSNLFAQITARSGITTTIFQPTATKSFLLVAIEYSAFVALILTTTGALTYYRTRKISFTVMILASVFSAAILILPWIAGFQSDTDLASRSELIFQIGVSPVLAFYLSKGFAGKRKILITIIVLSLLIFNALAYGEDDYRYAPTAPLSREDTRFNLEAWKNFGLTLCQFYQTGPVWGVRIASPFVNCTGIAQLVPGTSFSGPVVPVSTLTNLRHSLGFGTFVILRNSLDQVPEWQQPLPAPASQIFGKYDKILEAGDAYLIFLQ